MNLNTLTERELNARRAPVATYRHAYHAEEIALCAACAARDSEPAGPLGGATRGTRPGVCAGAAHIPVLGLAAAEEIALLHRGDLRRRNREWSTTVVVDLADLTPEVAAWADRTSDTVWGQVLQAAWAIANGREGA